MSREMKMLELFKGRLEEKGFNVLGITLRGSQNQGLADETSDVDAVAVVALSFEDLVLKKTISTKIEFEEGEVIVNDVMQLAKTLSKGNASFIEAVNSPFQIEKFEGVFDVFKKFRVNPQALLGMMRQKRKTVGKPTAGTQKLFDEVGFDVKDVSATMFLFKQLREAQKLGFIPKRFEVKGNDRFVIMNAKRKGLLGATKGGLNDARIIMDKMIEIGSDIVSNLKFEQIEMPFDELVSLAKKGM
jgi:hypothetical protein